MRSKIETLLILFSTSSASWPIEISANPDAGYQRGESSSFENRFHLITFEAARVRLASNTQKR